MLGLKDHHAVEKLFYKLCERLGDNFDKKCDFTGVSKTVGVVQGLYIVLQEMREHFP